MMVAGAFEDSFDCTACIRDERMRAAWGCDAPAAGPLYRITCPRCDGTDPDCELCEGHPGGQPMYRCPSKLITPRISRIINWYGLFDKGLLPVDGGVLVQSGTWLKAMNVMAREVAEVERERLKQD